MKNRGGFTIIEVIVAILVLTVGMLALASSAALVTRMITQGQIDTEASALANLQMEAMRGVPCDSLQNGNVSLPPHAMRWAVTPLALNRARKVVVEVASPTMRGTRGRVFVSTIFC